MRDRIKDLAALLDSAEDEERTMRLRRAETIGRPVGDETWLDTLQQSSGRNLMPRKRGRKRGELSALSP